MKRLLKHNQRGFTLLELLVVISIIGILVAIGAVAFSTAQQKSRDARRRSDIKAIQDAQEQYYSANSSAYAIFSVASPCSAGVALASYVNPFPTDPKNTGTSVYGCPTSTTSTYCVCALLESGGGNSTTGACAYSSSGGNYFCASQLQ